MGDNSVSFEPVIIIGAGRSGTNLLRDILTKLPHVATWPCDEINYIWRHGNLTYPTDELKPTAARPAVKQFIQSKFQQIAKAYGAQYVVEKTCANSLRVGFVNEIIPNAKYIFIVRDGRDVVASALKRWQAPLDLRYIAAKARYVPISDIPYYGFRYLGNRLYRLTSSEKRLAFWGPKFEGMDTILQQEALPVVCAHQWRRCVERSEEDFQYIDATRILCMRYEDLVTEFHATIRKVSDFIDINVSTEQTSQLAQKVRSDSIGKWQQELPEATINQLNPVIDDVQKRYGYV